MYTITIDDLEYQVKSAEDVAALPPRVVLALFNRESGKTLPRFRTKQIGIDRLNIVLGYAEKKRRAKKAEKFDPPAPKAEKPKKKAKRKAGQSKVTARLNGRSKIASGATISLCVDVNPKRHKSKARERFDLYKNGMTVEQFVAAGGLLEDVRWDLKHEFISLS